jgi:hypothetical protein
VKNDTEEDWENVISNIARINDILPDAVIVCVFRSNWIAFPFLIRHPFRKSNV